MTVSLPGVTTACAIGRHGTCSQTPACSCACHDGAESFPPFSGDKPLCAKCGHEGASTTYLAHGRCLHDGSHVTLGAKANERLHRSCDRCSFEWDEATVAR